MGLRADRGGERVDLSRRMKWFPSRRSGGGYYLDRSWSFVHRLHGGLLMKKNTVIVEEFDPDTNQISTRGTVGFVSWNGELLELQFENGTFTFEPGSGSSW